MTKKLNLLKDGALVTLISLFALILAFVVYFGLFLILESIMKSDHIKGYNFVSWLRLGYGIFLILLYIPVLRAKISEKLKAGILTACLAAFMISVGVQFYQYPVAVNIFIFLSLCGAVFLLYKMKKPWYFFYSLFLALLAIIIYI